MAQDKDFNFDLYRLIIHDDESLFQFMGDVIRSDEQIMNVVRTACNAQYDYRQEARRATYLWSLRNFVELPSDNYPNVRAFAVALAKATLEKDGVVVTSDSIQLGTSEPHPPLAEVVSLVFQINRHLVAVEVKSLVTGGEGWLKAFHEMLRTAASRLQFRSTLQLQPKPKKSEILNTFLSFQRLTRMKVQLLLPNPDLSRLTQSLFDELQQGGIREYIADMRNPSGLNQAEQTLPHAAAAMAEDGYKKGDVLLEGIRNGQRETIRTGTRPARGKVENMKDFVRGLASNAKTKEGRIITDAVLKEIERISDDQEVS